MISLKVKTMFEKSSINAYMYVDIDKYISSTVPGHHYDQNTTALNWLYIQGQCLIEILLFLRRQEARSVAYRGDGEGDINPPPLSAFRRNLYPPPPLSKRHS